MNRSVLVALRPSRQRVVAAVLAGLLTAGLGWFVGAGALRTALACVAVVVLAVLLRTSEPLETRWPDLPAPRTRPGWHVVVGAQRAMEAARTDRDDRRGVALRLDAAEAGGPDPRIDAARAAVGLPAPSTRRPR